MEAFGSCERPSWHSFCDRTGFLVYVYSSPLMVLFNLSAHWLCQNHPQISSRTRCKTVRTFLSTLHFKNMVSYKTRNFCIKVQTFSTKFSNDSLVLVMVVFFTFYIHFLQLGEETSQCSCEIGFGWEHMFGILVFPSCSQFLSATTGRTNTRELHQIPYLARTHCHDPFHSSWYSFHHLLGSYSSTFKGSSSCPSYYISLSVGAF